MASISPTSVRQPVPALLPWMVLALIAYASLYPFELDITRLTSALQGPWFTRMARARSGPVDTVANLFFYVPLGFVLLLRLLPAGRTAVRISLITAIGLAVSFGLEVLQHAAPTRTPSLLDVTLNTLSTAAGAALALSYARVERHWAFAWWMRNPRIDPVMAILLVAWLCLHAAPFIPRLGLYRAWVSLELVREWEWSVSGSARWFSCYLLLATTLRVLLKRERFWRFFWLAVAGSLTAQVLFIQHRLEPDEIIGAAFALPFIAPLRTIRTKKTLRLVWWLAVCGYALAALAPFNFSASSQTFHWLPFTGVLESNVENGFFSLTGKVFVYLGLLWVGTSAGSKLVAVTTSLFVIALVLELVQIFLPGRSAEFNDPMLVLIPAIAIALVERGRSGHRVKKLDSRGVREVPFGQMRPGSGNRSDPRSRGPKESKAPRSRK